MRKIPLLFCAGLLLAACNSETKTTAGKDDTTAKVAGVSDTKPAVVDSATAMKNWEAYMTPGKAHQWMASFSGSWTSDITMWMAPGAPPTQSKGTTVNKMAMDGRYQVSEHTGSWSGMPFNGMSTMAYDNAKKVFISTWIDNMGTGIMIGEGPWDEATGTATIKGTMVDPTTGKDNAFREVFKVIDADHQLMEMFATDPATGKEFKTMEIKYTRATK